MLARTLMFLLAFMPAVATLKAQPEQTASGAHGPLILIKPKQSLPAPRLKVLIEHDQEGVMLEVKGKYKLRDPKDEASRVSVRYTGKAKLLQAIPNGLKWGEEFPGVGQLEIIPASPITKIYVNGKEYRGKVTVYDIGRGTISVVNDVDLEDYIASLLSHKYPSNLPEEALAALAIGERTSAFFYSVNPKNPFWSVDGVTTGYKGVPHEDTQALVSKVMLNTRYMVLTPSGSYPGQITPFPVAWESGKTTSKTKTATSQLSLSDIQDMAKKGSNAAAILDKAFPRTSIQLLRSPG